MSAATNLGPRTIAECEKRGWPWAKVEYWNHFSHTRHDLFGCIDYLVLDGLPGVLGVQVTTNSNAAARVAKCQQVIPRQWLAANNRLQVWDWAKRGPVGKRKLWTVKFIDITLADLPALEETI